MVFFTRGMSLNGWQQAGILDRELALYRELSQQVDRFVFVTYGGASEQAWTSLLPSLEVLSNRWGIPPNLYSVLAPWLHRKSLRDASMFRTNQINGAWCGLVAKLLFRKRLIVRCGYLWADSVSRVTSSPWRRAMATLLERIVLRGADRIVVATDADASRIRERHGVEPSRVTVIPNFVDTRLFRPDAGIVPERDRIAFVGRLDVEKNVESLIDALEGLPHLKLTIVGDGPLRSRLEHRARERGVDIEFVGRLPHARVAEVLARSTAFVLPSHYEGHPKALVEAMACGVAVIGTRVPGIRDVIAHRETGLLCGSSPAEIRTALLELLNDAALRDRLRAAAMRYVERRCSLTLAAARERALLAELCPA